MDRITSIAVSISGLATMAAVHGCESVKVEVLDVDYMNGELLVRATGPSEFLNEWLAHVESSASEIECATNAWESERMRLMSIEPK